MVCNSIEKRLQHSRLPVKLAKFLKIPFLTDEFCWLLLTLKLVFLEEFRAKAGVTVSNKYQIQLKKTFAAAKIQKQLTQLCFL